MWGVSSVVEVKCVLFICYNNILYVIEWKLGIVVCNYPDIT